MNELQVNEIIALITGGAAMVIMWLARYFIAWINTQRGVYKMLIMVAIGFVITKINQIAGTGIQSPTDLLDPNVAQSLATWIVSMGLWAIVKEIQKLIGRYNLTKLKE